MTARRAIALVVMLAVLSIAGIVGMLLTEGVWDVAFFAMTMLPPLVALRRWWQLRTPR